MKHERVVGLILVAVGSLATLAGCGENNVSGTVHNQTATPLLTATPIAGPFSTPSPQAGPTATGAPQGDGTGCNVGTQCVSGHCIEGICCTAAACPAGERCDNPSHVGQCSPPAELAMPCTQNAHCRSGFCVDNACCAVAACAAGESCGVFGQEGQCAALPTATVTSTPTVAPTGTSTLPLPATPTVVPHLSVSTAAGEPGERVTIAVTLHTGGSLVGGTQNDIGFDPRAAIAAKANGKPDCTVNSDIDRQQTSFAFRPTGCSEATCTAIRALVLSMDNFDPIPDGSVLYQCTVVIAPEAANGVYPLTLANITLSDPQGRRIPVVDGVDGQVFVGATPTPTPTPGRMATRTATGTPTPALPAASLRVGSVAGAAGERVTIAVTLQTGGALIAGTQNDLHVDGVNVAIAAGLDGRPDCTVEPAIRKNATAFAFLPAGCAGTACTAVRGLVLAIDNTDPIADGSALYHCTVEVAAAAFNGVYPVRIDNIVMSNPQGGIPASVSGIDGQVFVGQVLLPALALSVAGASPGTQVSVAVSLHAEGFPVAGTQNDINFDPNVPIAARTNGRPDCTVKVDINKGATSFAFRPSGCSGATCTGIRALVLSTDNVDTISDGSVLYTCNVNVTADVSGFYPLTVSGVIMSTPQGVKVPEATGIDGAIVVGGGSQVRSRFHLS